jgi:hypothetical protein
MAIERAGARGLQVNRAERRVLPLLLGVTLLGGAEMSSAQEEEVATNFASLTYGAECDAQNKRLILGNAHTYKSLQIIVRWRAAGGKDLQEQFFPAPDTKLEIGCAAEAQIVEAKFAEF